MTSGSSRETRYFQFRAALVAIRLHIDLDYYLVISRDIGTGILLHDIFHCLESRVDASLLSRNDIGKLERNSILSIPCCELE
jgi:hypothetical protein